PQFVGRSCQLGHRPGAHVTPHRPPLDPLAAVVITPATNLLPHHLQASSTCADPILPRPRDPRQTGRGSRRVDTLRRAVAAAPCGRLSGPGVVPRASGTPTIDSVHGPIVTGVRL